MIPSFRLNPKTTRFRFSAIFEIRHVNYKEHRPFARSLIKLNSKWSDLFVHVAIIANFVYNKLFLFAWYMPILCTATSLSRIINFFFFFFVGHRWRKSQRVTVKRVSTVLVSTHVTCYCSFVKYCSEIKYKSKMLVGGALEYPKIFQPTVFFFLSHGYFTLATNKKTDHLTLSEGNRLGTVFCPNLKLLQRNRCS